MVMSSNGTRRKEHKFKKMLFRRFVIDGFLKNAPVSLLNSSRLSFSTVSMEALKKLRSRSGAPINECKKALEQTDGNLDDAVDWLRKHGAAKASSKLAGREAEQGLIGAIVSGNVAAMVQLNSETDFASRSTSFAELVEHVAKAALKAESEGTISNDELMEIEVDGKSVQSAMAEAVLSIRENLRVESATRRKVDEGMWGSYVHGRVSDNTGSSAALVHVRGASEDVLKDVGKKLAMHVVAAQPLFLSPDTVPDATLEKEKEILREQLKSTAKSSEMMEKIVLGKLRKFYESVCLIEQPHMVLPGNPKVATVLKDSGVEVTHFEYRSVGK
jgi:elongation factor Ts